MRQDTPWYLQWLIGFEDPPKEEEDPEGEEDDEDKGDDDDEGDDDEGEKGKKKEPESDSTDGLKSALAKERRENKKNARELKRLQRTKADEDDKDTKEVEKLRKQTQETSTKVTKLGEKLRDQALDTLIVKLAGAEDFRDADDALSLIKRNYEDWIDQDPDDPSDIEIDEKSVEAAVKALAKKKPHLIKADGETSPSGDTSAGRKKKDNDALSEEKLAEMYPALRIGS